jgi:hypothetical protein
MINRCTRVFLSPPGHLADANSKLRLPAERAAWVWHPRRSRNETAVLRFTLKFTLAAPATPLLHVTADQRFQLRCDGEAITFGPDRCDVAHWTVHSARVELPAGEHVLEAVAWFIGEPAVLGLRADPEVGGASAAIDPPMAQMYHRPGFLLYAEESPVPLTTGEAAWQVEDLTDAVSMEKPAIRAYIDVGPIFDFDLARWSPRPAEPAVVVMPPVAANPHGVRRPGWVLFPADLPEQRRVPWVGGRIRAVRDDAEETTWSPAHGTHPQIPAWQRLVDGASPLTIPPHTVVTALWDLETYRCGYPVTEFDGGRGTTVEWSWAESLYETTSLADTHGFSPKGDRNAVDGKLFLGFPDRWKLAGGSSMTPSLWWRCGRYVRVRVKTGDQPLTIRRLSVLTTGYPFERAGAFRSSDAAWDALMPLFENSFRVSAHETWTDSPYYEQMCYVGDNLMHAMSNYSWFPDDRVSRRTLTLLDWSRLGSGLVAERYPSGWRQDSSTYALLFPMMVRDYAFWRNDPAFVRPLLVGVRSVLAEFDGLAHDDGLLHAVPGWPFVDWVPEWFGGCGPGVYDGDSSIVNLFWVLSLLAAAELEDAHGSPEYAARQRRVAKQALDATFDRYWDAGRRLLRDTTTSDAASEHSHMLALLTGLLDEPQTRACLDALRRDDIAKATISASFYLLDALHRHGEAAEFHRRLDFWRHLPAQGFTATPEAPEPSRSDAHAWGAHPAYHTLASIAGIRPASPGFRTVRIAPLPGPMTHFDATCVHPAGRIDVSYRRDGAAAEFVVTLPADVRGELAFAGQTRPLSPGENRVRIGA